MLSNIHLTTKQVFLTLMINNVLSYIYLHNRLRILQFVYSKLQQRLPVKQISNPFIYPTYIFLISPDARYCSDSWDTAKNKKKNASFRKLVPLKVIFNVLLCFLNFQPLSSSPEAPPKLVFQGLRMGCFFTQFKRIHKLRCQLSLCSCTTNQLSKWNLAQKSPPSWWKCMDWDLPNSSASI